MTIIGKDESVFVCDGCLDKCTLVVNESTIDPEFCPFLSVNNCNPNWVEIISNIHESK